MEKLLVSLSQNFDNEAQRIVNYMQTNAEYSSDLFEQTYFFPNLTQRPSKLRGRKGAYVFLITHPVSLDHQTVFFNGIILQEQDSNYIIKHRLLLEIVFMQGLVPRNLYIRG